MTKLSKELILDLELDLRNLLGNHLIIQDHYSVSGGSINDCYELRTNAGKFFAKLNHASAYPGMFKKERRGLVLLNTNTGLTVPKPLSTGQHKDTAYLIMEFMETGTRSHDFWENFGSELAKMHRNSWQFFGLDEDNYIGSIPQQNNATETWTEFYIDHRLEFQMKRAAENGKIGADLQFQMEKLYRKLEDIFPKEPPALIHGDLWSGNFACTENGYAAIFDPAVYYGHREMDIGMSKLFGGFDPEFYDAYNEEWPLNDDWERRVDIANLYPLLVHVNLFGGGYLAQVRSVLQRFD